MSWILLLAGGALVIVGGIGLVRLPDFFSRLHAVSIPDTLGVGLITTGLILQAGLSLVSLKLLLILLFLLFTGPTATHALAKAALHGQLLPRGVSSEKTAKEDEQ
ncbi:MAG TPA: monovalent cation/H(+) antiporter subunit G [Arenicellales bacterium]|nr:monovalent cation/H(+) antiporter subunit G [Arenicellales bacterium]